VSEFPTATLVKKTWRSEKLSLVKFAFLSTLTFGLYNIYWFNRSWKIIKTRTHEDFAPWKRAASILVPIYGLVVIHRFFDEDVEALKPSGQVAKVVEHPGSILLAYILLSVVWRLNEPWDWFGFLSVVPFLYGQHCMNLTLTNAGDSSKLETHLSSWEIVISLVLGVLWILAIIGSLIPLNDSNTNGFIRMMQLQYMNA